MPQIYIPDAINDSDEDEAPIQTRTNLQNKTLLKIAILIVMDASTQETTHAIIDSGASCCVTPYLEDFLHQPTPIQNTRLKGIAGGLIALGLGTVQLKINQTNKEPILLIINNVIYAPDCPICLVSPQQIHRHSKEKGYEDSHVITEEITATQFHGGDITTCDYHTKTKIPMITCIPLTGTKQRTKPAKSSFRQQPHIKCRKRVVITKPTEISTYTSNLNTAQQELLHLHETCAHGDMQEIQHNIKTGQVKSTPQLYLCKTPKCQT
jgi:hypothetical protein